MKVIKSVKLVGVAAVLALSFIGNASALTVTGPNNTWTITKVPAVPEAETWAMMAVGLGLVGLRLRRKSKNDNTSVS